MFYFKLISETKREQLQSLIIQLAEAELFVKCKMPNGCQKCWQEFKGWLKAFTPLETLLTVLEAILLVLLIAFLIFLILHFLWCRGEQESYSNTTAPYLGISVKTTKKLSVTRTISSSQTAKKSRPTCTYTKVANKLATSAVNVSNFISSSTQATSETPFEATYATPTQPDEIVPIMSDGDVAEEDERNVVLALVKIKPSGVTFGCILTVVSERWTVTAASCLDSIEEVDSLDNFVIMENYDALNKGRSHAVTDVRVHPLYEGGNKSYDLALLRGEMDLGRPAVKLPSLLEYFKLPVGEAGTILGFGRFRTIDQSGPQRVHSAVVHILPSAHCVPPSTLERHLAPLPPVAHARCGTAPLCLGVLHARGAPCNYCAGAPLLRGTVLLGVMADNEQCGAACEPALYANVAVVRDWITRVLAH